MDFKPVLQHLRFRFSLLLLPGYLFSMWAIALQSKDIVFSHWYYFLIAGIVWHLFIFPASNAYNGYQDNDTASVGDIANPLPASKNVYYASLLFNVIGLCISMLINTKFFIMVLIYIIFSTLYSYRKVRLKKYAIIGFLTIFIFQGMWVVLATAFISPTFIIYNQFLLIALIAGFLFGGGYPISQIYQHKADKLDGVNTISMMLGIKGTLIFSALMFIIGFGLLLLIMFESQLFSQIFILICSLTPVVFFMSYWVKNTYRNATFVNHKNVMTLIWFNAICNNLAYIMLLLYQIN